MGHYVEDAKKAALNWILRVQRHLFSSSTNQQIPLYMMSPSEKKNVLFPFSDDFRNKVRLEETNKSKCAGLTPDITIAWLLLISIDRLGWKKNEIGDGQC